MTAGNEASGPTVNSLSGEQLAGEYEVLDALGHGATSVVYKVKRIKDEKIFAIKLLHSYLVEKEDTRKRFEQEAHAAMLLSHPNILKVHALEKTPDGQPYLLMEYVEGENMANVIKSGRMELPRAWKLFIQITDALCQAHSFGVVHRSIKPGNIILHKDSEGQEKALLSDFGLAKLLPSSGQEIQNLTAKGALIGTPLYMSPEQCLGREIDARADIYSMGCLMYACITGKPPLKGEHIIDTMQKHVGEIPLGFDKVCPELKIPSPAEKIIFKCMAKRPEDRYENIELLKQDLIRYQQGKRPKAMSMSISSVFAQQKLPDEPVVDDERYLKAALLVILALLVGLVAYAAWKGPERRDPSEVELGKSFNDTQRSTHPISALAMLKQADELRLLRREEEAKSLYRDAIFKIEERARNQSDVDHEVLAMAHYGLAGLYARVADWAEAEKELRLALYVQGLNNAASAPGKDRLLFELSDALVHQGKLNDAKQVLLSLQKDSKDKLVLAQVLVHLSDIAALSGKFAEAESNELQAISMLKGETGVARRYYSNVLYRYADGLLAQKQLKKCEKVLTEAMNERPVADWDEFDVDAAIYLTALKARTQAAAGNYKDAISTCKQTLAILQENSFPSKIKNFALTKEDLQDILAALESLSGNTEDAIKRLSDDLYINGDRFGHIATLARILIFSNHTADAQTLLAKYKKQAVKQNSLKAEYHALLALSLLQENKPEEALSESEVAVDALRKSSDHMLHTYCLRVKCEALRKAKRADAAAVIEKAIGHANPLSKQFDDLVPPYQLSDENH